MSKKEPADAQDIAYSYILYKYDGTKTGYWGVYDSLADVARINLDDASQLDLFQISVEYNEKTLLPFYGVLYAETYYVADRLQTFGEICAQNGFSLERAFKNANPNWPAVLLHKGPAGFCAHILDPKTDIVFDRNFKQIYPPEHTR